MTSFGASLVLFVAWPAFIFAAALCLAQALRKPRNETRGFE